MSENMKINEAESKVVDTKDKTQPLSKSRKPTEKEMKWEADRDMEMVSGVFKYHENPGDTMKFWFRAHAGQEIEKYELKDGEVCKIPLAVARHLNKNCWYSVDQHVIDKQTGLPSIEVGKKIRRCSFYPFGYVDLDDLSEVGVPYTPNKV